jgi:hypothetical protein
VNRAEPSRVTLDPDTRDASITRVLFDHIQCGEVRASYTSSALDKLEYSAYRRGRLIYGPADTLERAAQAVADYSINPAN